MFVAVMMVIYFVLVILSIIVPIFLRGRAEGKGTPFTSRNETEIEDIRMAALAWPVIFLVIPMLPFVAIYYVIHFLGKLSVRFNTNKNVSKCEK